MALLIVANGEITATSATSMLITFLLVVEFHIKIPSLRRVGGVECDAITVIIQTESMFILLR